MADLQHDTVCSSSSPPPEPDEFSLLLHQVLLRSSSFSSPSHSMPFLISPLPDNNNNIPYRPTPPDESSSSAWNVFPTSAACFPPPPATVLSSSSVGNTDNDLDDQHDCESEDGYEAMIEDPQPNLASARNYSKRSRAAEIHNLSEKRRRSRINEKMKALQKLIPNSNKTDKASMLDEAIEYLKQLQLQVQMLTMRNGLSLYPPELPPPAVLGRGLQSNNQVSHFRRSFGHENGVPTSSSSDILHVHGQEHGLNSQTMIQNHLAAPYQHHQYQTEDDSLASFSKQRNMMVHATDQRSSLDFQMGANFKDGLESTAPLSENSIFFDATFEWPEHRKRSYRG